MAKYSYIVQSKDNSIKKGQIEAVNSFEAKVFLRKRGFRILSVSSKLNSMLLEGEISVIGEFLIKNAKNEYKLIVGNQDPSNKEIIIFSKQLAAMIGSGVPLIKSINVLEGQQPSRGFRIALVDIRETVENGSKFSTALGKYPKIFDDLYVAMVGAGEASGNLDLILKKLVTYIEKAEKIKSQVKSAMTYPVLVLVIAVGVVSGLLLFVIPIFAKQFSETGRPLPWLTQTVVDFSDFFIQYWYIIFSFLGAMVYGFMYWKQTARGRILFDKYILKTPIIGDVLKKIAVGRFCSTMSSMLSSGVNLLQALSICAASAGNKIVEAFILNVRAALEKGQKFSTPLSEGDLFPVMVVSMVEVGESTGSLDEMLRKVSDIYEEEVDLAVKTMLSLIEPMMIVFLGGIIAFVVIAMYLPIFDMAGGM